MPNPTFQEYLRSRKILLTLAVLKRIDDLLSQANAVSTTDALGNAITYTYDARGRVSSRTDALGVTVNYSYDATGRLLRKTFPDGTTTEFTYDAQGNIITARNANVGYAIAYDSKGRVLSVTDSNSRVVSYTYDSTGARTRMTTPEGHTADYNYDLAGRLSAIVNGGGKRYEFGYDSMGRRKSLALPNGTSAAYVYDGLGRLTSLTHKTSSGDIIAGFTYTHDKVGNRLTKTETPSPLGGEGRGEGVSNSFTYDKIYRLLNSLPTKLNNGTQDNKAENFSYDAVGNRQTGPEAKETYSYDAGNELTQSLRANEESEAISYEYDKNGNLIKKTETDDGETWTYTYDFENRLVKVVKQETDETKTISFKYDPFGRRIEKKAEETEDGETETKTYTYVYDNEDVILEYLTKIEDGETKTETTRYVHGPGIDEPLAIERKGEMYYYHADGLGSITALTDAKQKVVESYTYTSFGELKRKGDKVKNTYTFTGREWDKEVKLYYYRARYYDPKTGRFISKDPIGFVGGDVNLYGYVGNNPGNRIDPLGLWVDPLGLYDWQNPFSYWGGFFGGSSDFYKNYSDMRQANWKAEGTDKYFHCKANCEAAQRVPGGSDAACMISNTREWVDQNIKRYSASDSAEDQVANQYGRNQGTINRGVTCTQICEPFRPATLPPQY